MFGWISTSKLGGQVVTDHDNDRITPVELEKMLYKAVAKRIPLGDMHERIGVGHLVEGVAMTAEKKAAMGIPDDGHVGAWCGFRVTDDQLWDAVTKGLRPEFSIGGEANRTPSADGSGAFDLTDIDLDETSAVDAGAGIHVPVVFAKRKKEQEMQIHKRLSKYAKGLAELAKTEEGRKLLEKLNAFAETVQKDQLDLAALADIQGKLSPEEWKMVLQAIESGIPMAGAPKTEPVMAAAPGEPAAPVAPPVDPMAMAPKALKEDPMSAELKKSNDELRATLAKQNAQIVALEKSGKIAKAKAEVAKDFATLPGDEALHAEAIVALDDAIANTSGLVEMSSAVAKHLKETLLKSAAAIKAGALLKREGGNGPGAEIPLDGDESRHVGLTPAEAREELGKIAAGLRKEDRSLTEAGSRVLAMQKNRVLYQISSRN